MHIPEKTNLETFFTIKKEFPHTFVIMVSDTNKINTAAAVLALQLEALDFILIQTETGWANNVSRIKSKLQGLFTQIMTKNYTTAAAFLPEDKKTLNSLYPVSSRRPDVKKRVLTTVDLIVIAASTGGPAALKYILKNISQTINVPILIVQHMPAEFTGTLAQSLNKKSTVFVTEASDNYRIKPGEALLAPGGMHLTVDKNISGYFARLLNSAPVNGVKPSADVLFNSIANICPKKKILAVILTGMGSDGLAGVRALKRECDCFCLVQSERTCVVYGMPGSVVQAGLADEIRDLHLLPECINAVLAGRC